MAGVDFIYKNLGGPTKPPVSLKCFRERLEPPRVCRISELYIFKARSGLLLDLIDAYHISRDAEGEGKWISLRVWRRVNSKIQKRDTIRRRLLRLGWGPDTFDPDRGDYVPKWVVEAAERVLDWRSL